MPRAYCPIPVAMYLGIDELVDGFMGDANTHIYSDSSRDLLRRPATLEMRDHIDANTLMLETLRPPSALAFGEGANMRKAWSIAVFNNYLVAQAEPPWVQAKPYQKPKPTSQPLLIVVLDTGTGKQVIQASIQLPSNVWVGYLNFDTVPASVINPVIEQNALVVVWHFTTGHCVRGWCGGNGGPAPSPDSYYVVDKIDGAARIDMQTGQVTPITWNIPQENRVSPSSDFIWHSLSVESIPLGSSPSELRAVDIKTGAEVWRIPLYSTPLRIPIP